MCGVPTSQNLQICSQCLPQILLNSDYVDCPAFLLEMSWPPDVTSDLIGPEKFGAKTCEVEAHEDFRCLLVACSMLGRNPAPFFGKRTDLSGQVLTGSFHNCVASPPIALVQSHQQCHNDHNGWLMAAWGAVGQG